MLRDILNMLEEVSLSLPRFRTYENTLPMNEALETSLLAAYTEMTCFCARTINFFRRNPHGKLPAVAEDIFALLLNRLSCASTEVMGRFR